ncbi:hypothetical protein GDO78_018065, partial [Eleutherodactylus coqui]
ASHYYLHKRYFLWFLHLFIFFPFRLRHPSIVCWDPPYERVFLMNLPRMDGKRKEMAESLLHLTLEIFHQLTGEDYTAVKKTSSERWQNFVSEGHGRTLSPITGPSTHHPIHEDFNGQKILEHVLKMTELLTGEVPIRSQDVSVYFSMKEWEYLEGHKDLYKEVMMEDQQPLTSQGNRHIAVHVTLST